MLELQQQPTRLLADRQTVAAILRLHQRLEVTEARLTELERTAAFTRRIMTSTPPKNGNWGPLLDRMPHAVHTLLVVAGYCGVLADDIVGRSRITKIANARHVVAYLLSTDCQMSSVHIGRVLNRDHSSVLYGIRHIRELVEVRGPIYAEIEAIRRLRDTPPA